jgi:flagellar L-ring protein FlgH
MIKLTLIVVVLYGVCCALALGQAAGQPGQGPQGQQQNSGQGQADPAGAMREHGGSLLRATLATRPDPSQAPLSAVSFFAVPEPEPRTVQKHDLVTIIVREQSEFSSEGSAEHRRQANLDARIEEMIRLNLAQVTVEPGDIDPLAIRANGARQFRGEGSIDRSDSLIARIQAEVVDVKPNGTLVLQARKRIRTDDEIQTLILTGICRAEDITADNTLLSTQLFDLDLEKHHKGGVRNSTRRGALGRLLDFINPF